MKQKIKRIGTTIVIILIASFWFNSRNGKKKQNHVLPSYMQPLDKKLFVVPLADNECDNNFTFSYDLSILLESKLDYPKDACWKPYDCQRGQRILVIVPYRDRRESLDKSIPILHHFLRSQKKDYCILVVEQADQNFFNKALLMNAGALESNRFGDFNCFIFHDVDMLPEVNELDYSCRANPTHLSPSVSKFFYNLNYGTDFGGVVALTKLQFEHVNGYSNRFWGWGAEDDEMNQRIYSSGLTREAADPMLGRFTMLEHQHSWSFDPSHKITMSTNDVIFREIRQKYKWSRNDELGSKPNDWKMDGLNTAKFQVVNATEMDGYIHMYTDVSLIRLSNISVSLRGVNEVNLTMDYEATRYEAGDICKLNQIEGYLPQNNSIIKKTDSDVNAVNESAEGNKIEPEPVVTSSAEDAITQCKQNLKCYGISNINKNKFFLHEETPIMDNCFIHVAYGGNGLKYQEKERGQLWLKKCQNRQEALHQIVQPLQLQLEEYSEVVLDFEIKTEYKLEDDIILYTTLTPTQEMGTTDLMYYQAQKRVIANMVRSRIQKIEYKYFKDKLFNGSFFFNLPPLPGSYEAHTVISDRNARPIGLLRWAWTQESTRNYDPVILRILHHEVPFPRHTAKMHSGWIKLHNQKI